MSIQDERLAMTNAGFDDAMRQAVKLAAEGSESTVYFDGKAIFVRSSYAPKPEGAQVICIAQKWNEKTVQLRFAGARSEWVSI